MALRHAGFYNVPTVVWFTVWFLAQKIFVELLGPGLSPVSA